MQNEAAWSEKLCAVLSAAEAFAEAARRPVTAAEEEEVEDRGAAEAPLRVRCARVESACQLEEPGCVLEGLDTLLGFFQFDCDDVVRRYRANIRELTRKVKASGAQLELSLKENYGLHDELRNLREELMQLQSQAAGAVRLRLDSKRKDVLIEDAEERAQFSMRQVASLENQLKDQLLRTHRSTRYSFESYRSDLSCCDIAPAREVTSVSVGVSPMPHASPRLSVHSARSTRSSHADEDQVETPMSVDGSRRFETLLNRAQMRNEDLEAAVVQLDGKWTQAEREASLCQALRVRLADANSANRNLANQVNWLRDAEESFREHIDKLLPALSCAEARVMDMSQRLHTEIGILESQLEAEHRDRLRNHCIILELEKKIGWLEAEPHRNPETPHTVASVSGSGDCLSGHWREQSSPEFMSPLSPSP